MPDENSPVPTTEENKLPSPICGIVMPIAAIGEDYPEEHWRRVKKILQRAIERAGMRSQLVWENAEVDVIQSAILQNLYENDVVVCDVSGLNPNVMLEAGLRLSTKKPTVIVTDRILKPPFDISTIGYIDYQRDLEYNAIELFIDRLSQKIKDVNLAQEVGSYKSFVEQFTFETVTPSKVTVTTDEYIREKLDQLTSSVRRIERASKQSPSLRGANRPPVDTRETSMKIGEFLIIADEQKARQIESELDSSFVGAFCMRSEIADGKHRYSVHRVPTIASSLTDEEIVDQMIKVAMDRASPSD